MNLKEQMGRNFQIAHVGHENNAANLSFYGIFKVFQPLMGESNIVVVEQEEPVKIDMGESVVLLPRAPEMIQSPF